MLAMERLDPAHVANIILAAPGWARVGITMPDQAMRERAADTIAATIVERIAEPEPADERQMALPIL